MTTQDAAQIKVVIRPDGTVAIEVIGIAGPACLAATEGLRKALGGVELQHGVTLDYYAQSATETDALDAYAQQLRASSDS